jgi:hypothetical protein
MRFGLIHRRKLFVSVMDCLRTSRMLYQCVVALPSTLWQLVKFHFDFYAFVDRLNHERTSRLGAEISKISGWRIIHQARA